MKAILFTLALGAVAIAATILLRVFLGPITLYVHDDTFIKIKVTLINALLSAILLGNVAFGRNLLKVVMSQVMSLPDAVWRSLTIRWGVFFLLLAVMNEVLWRNVSTDTWIAYRWIGFVPLVIIFSLSQIPLVLRHDLKAISKKKPQKEKQE